MPQDIEFILKIDTTNARAELARVAKQAAQLNRRIKRRTFLPDVAYAFGFILVACAVYGVFGAPVAFVFLAAGIAVYSIANGCNNQRWHRFVRRSRVARYLLGRRDPRHPATVERGRL